MLAITFSRHSSLESISHAETPKPVATLNSPAVQKGVRTIHVLQQEADGNEIEEDAEGPRNAIVGSALAARCFDGTSQIEAHTTMPGRE